MLLTTELQKKFENLAVERGYLSQEELDRLKLESQKQNKSLVAIINEGQYIEQENLVRLEAEVNGFKYVDLRTANIKQEILELIPQEIAQNYQAVPIGYMNNRLVVAMLDPNNLQAVDFIGKKIDEPIQPVMASEDSIDNVLNQYSVSEQVSKVIDTVDEFSEEEEKYREEVRKRSNAPTVTELVQDAPVTRALKTIIDHAVNLRASDIHIEPKPEIVRVRFRIDGILQEIMTLPKSIEPAIVSRVKIMSELKIDEHRLPQDGEFRVNVEGEEIDVRVSVSPVVYGEKVVLRLLHKDNSLLSFKKMGFRGRALRLVRESVKKPHGMTLSTGPTGSGKSTTLYTCLTTIQNPEINIVTLEDPVEYKIEGVNQIQINHSIGLTFASGLRSVLRQDPDVVMVGEIRDHETADLAVQAALTGHLVFSTLHTNSAAGVLPRLLDMKIESFLVASTVNTIIGQRLLRRICDNCKKEYKATESEIKAIKEVLKEKLPKNKEEQKELKQEYGFDVVPLESEDEYTLYRGEGCEDCKDGYKGRLGIFEVFEITPTIEKLLVENATSTLIQEQAIKDGMVTMRQDGYFKALNGETTLAEANRVTSEKS